MGDGELNRAGQGEERSWADRFLLVLVLFGSTLSSLAFVAVTPGLPRIAEHFAGRGDDTLRAQFVLTMAPVGMAFGGLLAGWVIERLGLRRALFTALLATALLGVAPAFLDNLYAIFAVRFLLGWATVTIDICMTTVLSARFEGDRRARVIGFKQGVGSTMTVSGTLISGWLIQHYGWRAPFFLFLIAFLYFAVALAALRRPVAHVQQAARFNAAVLRALWPIYVLVVVLAIAHTMPHFQLPFLLAADGMSNAAKLSWFPATSAAVSVLSAASFGLIYGFARRWTIVAALLLMGGSFVWIGSAPGFTLIFVAVLIEGLGGGLMLPYLSHQVLERAPVDRRSQAFGLLLSVMFIGQFFDPIVLAPLREVFGIHDAFVAVGFGLLVIALVMSLAVRRPRTAVA